MPPRTTSRVRARVSRIEPDIRALLAASLAEAVGKGVFLSGSVVFFTLHAGLSASTVGLGISAAGLAGFVASLVFGTVADRVGARRLLIALFLADAACFACYPFVRSATAFFVVVVLLGFVEWGMGPTKGAIVGALVPPEARVRVQAANRTVFNVGVSIGSAVAAVAIVGRSLLVLIPVCTMVGMLAAALLVFRLPVDAPGPDVPEGFGRFTAIRDGRFLAVVGVAAVQATHISVLMVALPLWILNRTSVSHALVPLTLIVNTVIVILFQVRASRGADTVRGAAGLARRSGWWLACACVVIALAGASLPTAAATAALLCAVVLLSITEVMQSASAWGLAFGLAPAHARGEYLGTFELHLAGQNVVGPAVVAGLVIAHGAVAWLAIAAIVLVSSVLIGPAARASERSTSRRLAESLTPQSG